MNISDTLIGGVLIILLIYIFLNHEISYALLATIAIVLLMAGYGYFNNKLTPSECSSQSVLITTPPYEPNFQYSINNGRSDFDRPYNVQTTGDADGLRFSLSSTRGEGTSRDLGAKFHCKNADIYALNDNLGCDGDNAMAKRMMLQSSRSKQSKDIRAKFDTDSMRRYYADELERGEKRIWWEDTSDLNDWRT
jgi:hypothetical protein